MGQKPPEFQISSFASSASVDRGRFQERLASIEHRMRRRVRGILRRVNGQVYDLDDVFASARRRLDVALIEGRLRVPNSDEELESLLQRAARRVAADSLRRQRRQWSLYQRMIMRDEVKRDGGASRRFDLDALLRTVDLEEQEMLRLWASGVPHATIADSVGLSFEAHRSRWRRLMAKLRLRVLQPNSKG